MKSAEDIGRYFQNSTLSTNHNKHEAIFEKIQRAQNQSRTTAPGSYRSHLRRTIMKSPITKLAAAAAVIIVVSLGFFEFVGDGSTSSIIWADVAKKVEASRGVVVRCTDSIPSDEHDHSITYTSPRDCRKDFYKDGQIYRTGYVDFTDPDTYTLIDVFHKRKFCLTTTFRKSEYRLFLEWHADWTNPGFMVQTILSCEHSTLGQKTIEGVLCEGIETADPACLGPLPAKINKLELEFRLWVSVETGYPVLFESKMNSEYQGEVGESAYVMDQFQWDVELDPSTFEPNIPSDYEAVQRPGIVEL
jgi:hypothetical protein